MIVPIDRVGIVDYRTVKQKCYTHAVIELETFPSIVHSVGSLYFSVFPDFAGSLAWFSTVIETKQKQATPPLCVVFCLISIVL